MWNKCSGNTTSFTKKAHHSLALPDLVQCLLCLSYGFLSSVLYCYGGISQNASSINLRHFVSVRRSRNFGRARKTASKKKKLCQKIGVGAGGEHERAQDWAYGTGVTVWLCCEKQYATFRTNFYLFAVVFFVSKSLSGVQRQRKLLEVPILTLKFRSMLEY